ncbi:MAG: hypothetical protein HGJ94_18410 [Desulfosarcina sp.]|nr:hypothetical protein [Desulfosarcina sp.]
MAGKEVKCTFNMEEEMYEWFQKASFDLDAPKSVVIRACILMALDILIKFPILLNLIQFSNRKQ